MKQNPGYVNGERKKDLTHLIDSDYQSGTAPPTIEKFVSELATSDLNKLVEAKALVFESDEYSFKPTEVARIMARYNLNFPTVQLMSQIPPDAEIETLIELLSRAAEFSDLRPRQGEKKVLNEINKGVKKKAEEKAHTGKKKESEGRRGVRFPIKDGIKDTHDKVSVLLQGTISIHLCTLLALMELALRVASFDGNRKFCSCFLSGLSNTTALRTLQSKNRRLHVCTAARVCELCLTQSDRSSTQNGCSKHSPVGITSDASIFRYDFPRLDGRRLILRKNTKQNICCNATTASLLLKTRVSSKRCSTQNVGMMLAHANCSNLTTSEKSLQQVRF